MKVSNSLVSAYGNIPPKNLAASSQAHDGHAARGLADDDQKQVVLPRGKANAVPAEKIIEGELLGKSQGISGVTSQSESIINNAFVDFLQARRFSTIGGHSSGTRQPTLAAEEGINAYISNANLGSADNANSSVIDIFA